jgi:hypothetical protein
VCDAAGRPSFSTEGRVELDIGASSSSSSSSSSVDVAVANLAPDTEYDVFVVASNAAGASHVFAPVSGVSTASAESRVGDSSSGQGMAGGAVAAIVLFAVLCGLAVFALAAWIAVRRRAGEPLLPAKIAARLPDRFA